MTTLTNFHGQMPSELKEIFEALMSEGTSTQLFPEKEVPHLMSHSPEEIFKLNSKNALVLEGNFYGKKGVSKGRSGLNATAALFNPNSIKNTVGRQRDMMGAMVLPDIIKILDTREEKDSFLMPVGNETFLTTEKADLEMMLMLLELEGLMELFDTAMQQLHKLDTGVPVGITVEGTQLLLPS